MPYDESAVEIVRDTLLIAMKIAAPILLAGVVVGLVLSVLQAVTSIQDQAITFVPKLGAMILVAVLLLPWIVLRLVEFASGLLSFGAA